MTLNQLAKQYSIIKRWVATGLLLLFVSAFAWQSSFFSDTIVMASPSTTIIAATDLGDKIQNKASRDAERTKDFVEDTANKVEKTAKKNANKVDRATDNETSFLGRKAKKDQSRIEAKAEKDSAKTKKAIDDTKNIVERTVDSIKDTFGG